MRAIDKMSLRFRSLFRRDRVEAELDTEMRFHLDQLIEENLADGLPPEEARARALRSLGSMTGFQEDCRDMRRVNTIEGLLQDARYAIRTLRKTPVFFGVVACTLALGIGGITAIFSVVQAVLLAPLPYEAPGQLVRFYQQAPNDPASRYFLTGVHFRELREHASSFEDVAAVDNYAESGLDLVTENRAQRLRVLGVTADYFQTLRPGILRGPGFTREDERGARLVILSDALWRSAFGSDISLIGRTIRLSAEAYTVAGIAPAAFKDPVGGEIDAWVPYNLASNDSEGNYSISAVGRLRNGVTLSQAGAELESLSRALAERWPNTRLPLLTAQPLKDDLVAHSRGTLNVLAIAVLAVLFVACLNVANLFLVRSTARAREFAIRAALGSGGMRIARQLLVESGIVAAAGGLLGLGLGVVTLEGLRALGGNAIPRLREVGLDPVVLGFTAAVTLLTGLAFGMIPAIRFARIRPSDALHQQSRSATGDRRQGWVRGGLAILQFAFALILLASAGVLIVSYYRLQEIDFGFRTDGVFTFEVNLPAARYDIGRRIAFQEELARRLEAIPGVSQAGGTSRLPATGSYHPWPVRSLTGPRAGTDFRIRSQHRVVSGDYFGAMAIPVLAGRVFDARDDAGAPARAVVSARLAKEAFPGLRFEEIPGHRIRFLTLEREIIGVVGDVALDARGGPAPNVYHAHRQFAASRSWSLTHVLATALPPDQALAAVRDRVAALDPQLVVYRAAPMADIVGRGVARERFALVLMSAFALVALALAAIGLYGVLAYSVRQRTQEIGIRMALGATAGQIRGLVLKQASVLLGIGIAIGLGGAVVMGRWLSALVYETSPSDPRVLAATALLLTIVAILSAWLPAWRASRLEPRIAMQDE